MLSCFKYLSPERCFRSKSKYKSVSTSEDIELMEHGIEAAAVGYKNKRARCFLDNKIFYQREGLIIHDCLVRYEYIPIIHTNPDSNSVVLTTVTDLIDDTICKSDYVSYIILQFDDITEARKFQKKLYDKMLYVKNYSKFDTSVFNLRHFMWIRSKMRQREIRA